MQEKRKNIIVIKSELFADRVIKMCKYLSKKKTGDKDMIRQIYRSGTSIGANVAESQYAQSRADFLTKMSIALKEANETGYWLELLYRTEYLSEPEYKILDSACASIRVMLISSINTAKQNMNKDS